MAHEKNFSTSGASWHYSVGTIGEEWGVRGESFTKQEIAVHSRCVCSMVTQELLRVAKCEDLKKKLAEGGVSIQNYTEYILRECTKSMGSKYPEEVQNQAWKRLPSWLRGTGLISNHPPEG